MADLNIIFKVNFRHVKLTVDGLDSMQTRVRFSLISAHWGCIRVSGGWGEPSLQEFDYNPFTKDQVFIKINDF